MQKYAFLISYVGTNYWGWQRQKTQETAKVQRQGIQEVVEAVLHSVTEEPEASLIGSGRTDSGVHAVGQVAHATLRKRVWNPYNLKRGMNSRLPPDIRVVAVKPVDIEFHAQRSALKKQYSYYFQQGPAPLPMLEPYSWWIHKKLDVDAMNEGVQALVGEHDFKPFQGAGSKPGSTVREIFHASVEKMEPNFPSFQTLGGLKPGFELVRVRVVGSGFLKQMVRGICGTILQIGEGRRPSSDFKTILETGDRSLLGMTAPARALWLEQVWYPNLDWRE